MKNLARIFLFLMCSCALLAAPVRAEEQSPPAVDDIRYCRPNNMVSSLAYIADSQHFFKEAGLNVQFETATNAKLCQDMVIAGRADFVNGADGPFTYIAAAPENPLVAVAFLQKNPETAVFARADRGIKSLKDLKGKRVAYLPGTISFFFLVRVLESVGLRLQDLSLVPMQPPAMPKALVGGSVDAFAMWEPWGTNALKELGDNGLRLAAPSIYRYHDILSTTREVRDNRPRVITKVLKALLRSEEFLRISPDEAISILRREIAFPPGVLEALWKNYEHRVSLNRDTIKLLEENFQWLKRTDPNFKDIAVPNFYSLVDASFLRALDKSRVDETF